MGVNIRCVNVEAEIRPVIRCVIILGCSVCAGIIGKILSSNLNLKITQITTLRAITDVIGTVKVISTCTVGGCRSLHRIGEEHAENHHEREQYEHRARKDFLV